MEDLVCARCAGSLEEVQIRDLALARCRQCRGLFFDPGDLARVLTDQKGGEGSSGTDSTACPRCQVPMDRIPAGGEGWFSYEQCPACRALWLDASQFGHLEQASIGSQIEAGRDPESRRRRTAVVLERLEALLSMIERQRDDRLGRIEKLYEPGLGDAAEIRSIRAAIDVEERVAREALGRSRLFEETRQLCIGGFISGAKFESLRQRVAAG